ncbi:MAG: formylglycine-generating enzyme family protein [Anaerolineae bacterium]|nr:formylglycine-generating enzyme family protein [Candidatus Roseilinea sp.]MDW8449879.1 formylglycine-generating enzyme family protein [Anaerolineae bacterium]
MVWIPGGTFLMGSDKHYPEEAPAHKVRVDGFWMDAYLVTNADFAAFVEATGYVTVAERTPKAEDYPGALPHMLVPGSMTFRKPKKRVDMRNHYNWWVWTPGANWRHPYGPDTSIEGRERHPVVHVAYEDVEAYLAWAGKTLPTEAEWEFAARGGLEGKEFAWGDELTPGGQYLANFWQGEFPYVNHKLDGYEGTSPVGAFPPNGYGLFDMIGNVWEWTCDWYQAGHTPSRTCCAVNNPRGGARERSYDPAQPDVRIPRRVLKGGSHLCAENYCRRYRPAARMPQAIDTGTNHIGFRGIVRVQAPTTLTSF